jgi:hypothetical protein
MFCNKRGRRRRRMKTKLVEVVLLAGMILSPTTYATNVVITSLSGNGVLTWATDLTNASYDVQWASALSAPAWTNSWASLVDIVPTGATHSVSVPMFYRIVAEQPRSYRCIDYYPTDPNVYGRKVFLFTNLTDHSSGVGTNEIATFHKVPYKSGTIVGVEYSGGDILYSDGDSIGSLLGEEGAYNSTDTNLTAYPSCLLLNRLHDGMVVSQSYYVVADDLSGYYPVNQKIMVQIRDVTVPAGCFSNSLVFWTVDLGYAYTNVDMAGMDAEMGVSIPTSVETGGFAVGELSVMARGVGPIAYCGLNSESGDVDDILRLSAMLPP